nr:isoform 3 of mrna-capping enzyme [Quercus suber]
MPDVIEVSSAHWPAHSLLRRGLTVRQSTLGTRTSTESTPSSSCSAVGDIKSAGSHYCGLANEGDAEPGLFKKHSALESFTTPSGITYDEIRVWYHAHSQAAKLPPDLPLLVFLHGLGGNATQFSPLLTSMINVGPCLVIDLPGCGLSALKPKDSSAYTPYALAELLFSAIDRYRDKDHNQKVVIIGHSMGCAIATLLVSSTSPISNLLHGVVIGMIAITPRSSPLAPHEAANVQRLRYVPTPFFDFLRFIDRRGGLDSQSITRVVGKGAEEETRKLQAKYNSQSKSETFLRIIIASLPKAFGGLSDGWPSETIWAGIKVPLFLIAGESDHLTPPSEVEQIAQWLTHPQTQTTSRLAKAADGEEGIAPDSMVTLPDRTASADTIPATAGDAHLAEYQINQGTTHLSQPPSTPSSEIIKESLQATSHSLILKITVFPAPAAHGLMYATSTVRILSGLIESFLASHVDKHLSLGWQLQHLTTSGKWDVKNLQKWQRIDACSEPIAGVFRAMKTMREVDDHHRPTAFVEQYSSTALPNGVAMVVDISHESPVYNPKGLEEGGVEYHKFPCVSKLPPNAEEVEHFISLIDELRRSPRVEQKGDNKPTIGVHCHYGFNRTGFFIVCYMVERLGYKLQVAVDEFASKRPPGIKHEHFVNELFVRHPRWSIEQERTLPISVSSAAQFAGPDFVHYLIIGGNCRIVCGCAGGRFAARSCSESLSQITQWMSDVRVHVCGVSVDVAGQNSTGLPARRQLQRRCGNLIFQASVSA